MFYTPIIIRNATAERDASHAKFDARQAKDSVRLLNHEIERLLMITEAQWLILKDQHGYTDSDLMKKVSEIDMRDGKIDGKVAPKQVSNCPSCKRKMFKHRPICLYCGKPVEQNLFQR